MALYGNHDAVLALAGKIKNHCIINQQSLLTDKPLWTPQNFEELHTLYVEHPDSSPGKTFEQKIDIQLEEASNEAIQLFAELYILDLLVLGNVSATKKIENITHLLNKCDPPVSLTEEVINTFNTGGVLSGGQGYNTSRWGHLVYLINLGQEISTRPLEERAEAFTPQNIEHTLLELDVYQEAKGKGTIQKALCFLFDPEHYVDIISDRHLQEVTRHFTDNLTPEEHKLVPQRQARIIKEKIREERKSPDWNFYLDPEEWDPLLTVKTSSSDEAEKPEDDETTDEELTLTLPPRLAESLLIPQEWLDGFLRTLNRKKQVILQGPPGTGKTFLAKRIAANLAGSEERMALVQFHPSYTYEDFFEGFRPSLNPETKTTELKLRPGIFRRIAQAALENPEYPYFLIIDEINRGNLSSIFGELYFLLEYRREEVELMYSEEKFTMPENLFIIGTMNTSDRSIALIDSAMRRRFAFYTLHPDSEPTQSLLSRWAQKYLSDDSTVPSLWKALNDEIKVKDFKIGPSYFMRPDIEEQEILNEVWETEILPLLSEYFHQEQESLHKRFEIAEFLKES